MNVFIVDPMELMRMTEDELVELMSNISKEAASKSLNDSIHIAERTILLSDAQTIVGELLARYKLLVSQAKLHLRVAKGVSVKTHREAWEKAHPDVKITPASTYFDSLSIVDTEKKAEEFNKLDSSLSRYNKFYDNYETKINALKKLSDRVMNLEPKNF